jgi:hypothetical protein
MENEIVTDWKQGFIYRVKEAIKSRKQEFSYLDAVNKSSSLQTDLDRCMITYIQFIESNPLCDNDYFKYVDSYSRGKELDLKYFKHDSEKLKDYYKKFDSNKDSYCPFNKTQFENYVLFMALKLHGFYKPEYDKVFNVIKKGSREYNPLTNIPSVIRGELPFKVKEYDICRAFSTFIDNELSITRKEDVYSLIDKREFLKILNLHSKHNTPIDKVRGQLACVYNGRVNEVITEDRFNNAGQMYRDLTIHEDAAITAFVTANNVDRYVRLHDGVFVLADVLCDRLEVDKVKFSIKECIKPPILNHTFNFYTTDEYGEEVFTSPKAYSDFFAQENFIRITEQGRDVITIFKDSNNVIKPFNHKTDVIPFLKENINDFFTTGIENQIAHDNFGDVQKGYLLLRPIPLKYHRDSKNDFGIAFKNGFVRYTKGADEVEVLPYKDVDGFFAPHDAQERIFTYKQDEKPSVFQLFLTMASTGKNPLTETLTDEDNITFDSFCSMYGYLLHQYKNQSNNPAIVLSDKGANDASRNGGRGKSLLTKAVAEVRNVMLKGGKEFDPNYLFNYADLTKAHDIFIIDDVSAGFNYNALYTQISGGINVQLKGKPAQLIPFNEAPKFVITTNWSYRVEDDSTSTQRRFFEYQFTDFFNLENKPDEVFGHNFFEDWDAKEWDLFYNFSFYCVGLYLENGLTRIAYDKSEDNFRASFNNDVVLDEMQRIIDALLLAATEFSVSDFLNMYKKFDNNLRFENYFNHNNCKKMIEVFIKHHNKPLKYNLMVKKWIKI